MKKTDYGPAIRHCIVKKRHVSQHVITALCDKNCDKEEGMPSFRYIWV